MSRKTVWIMIIAAALVLALLAVGFMSRHNEVLSNETRQAENG